jgi:hypothetical protein
MRVNVFSLNLGSFLTKESDESYLEVRLIVLFSLEITERKVKFMQKSEEETFLTRFTFEFRPKSSGFSTKKQRNFSLPL